MVWWVRDQWPTWCLKSTAPKHSTLDFIFLPLLIFFLCFLFLFFFVNNRNHRIREMCESEHFLWLTKNSKLTNEDCYLSSGMCLSSDLVLSSCCYSTRHRMPFSFYQKKEFFLLFAYPKKYCREKCFVTFCREILTTLPENNKYETTRNNSQNKKIETFSSKQKDWTLSLCSALLILLLFWCLHVEHAEKIHSSLLCFVFSNIFHFFVFFFCLVEEDLNECGWCFEKTKKKYIRNHKKPLNRREKCIWALEIRFTCRTECKRIKYLLLWWMLKTKPHIHNANDFFSFPIFFFVPKWIRD